MGGGGFNRRSRWNGTKTGVCCCTGKPKLSISGPLPLRMVISNKIRWYNQWTFDAPTRENPPLKSDIRGVPVTPKTGRTNLNPCSSWRSQLHIKASKANVELLESIEVKCNCVQSKLRLVLVNSS